MVGQAREKAAEMIPGTNKQNNKLPLPIYIGHT